MTTFTGYGCAVISTAITSKLRRTAMSKITLPPKVKCWRCRGGRKIYFPVAPNCQLKEGVCPDCDDDGYRYVFDDLAQAATEAGYSWERLMESQPQGLAPTTVLLNAITDVNSR